MLTSQLGIRLVLWMGDPVPQPAPYQVATALARVEVTNDARQGDGFQMTFTLGKDQSLEYSLLKSGALEPFTRVIIGVIVGVTPEVLIDGVITHHHIAPSDHPGQSTLTVTGSDVSAMLDLEEKNAKYENQPDSLIVSRLLLNYAQYGLVPEITPTTDVPLVIERIPRQQETDLKFIQRLARRNGFVFYLEPLTFGANTAHFGAATRVGLPQPALATDLGAATNVKNLSFANDALAPESAAGVFVEPITKTSIPIPALPSLRLPALAASPASARRTTLLRHTANQDAAQAAISALAAVTNAPDAVRGQGELDTVRYGGVLRARRLIGVRGAGLAYDGVYYLERVTHSVARGHYTQSFSLSREGTGSLLTSLPI